MILEELKKIREILKNIEEKIDILNNELPAIGHFDMPIDALELSTLPHNCLLKNGFKKLNDIRKTTLNEIVKIPSIGTKSAVEISLEYFKITGEKIRIKRTSYTNDKLKNAIKSIRYYCETYSLENPCEYI